MCENDSLNDSSEIFNLYSSKKVTDIYNSQLLKLIDNKNSIIDEDLLTTHATNINSTNKSECVLELCKEKVTSVTEKEQNKGKTIIGDLDVVELSDGPVDDSVEIVEVDSPGIRRSARLKNKQKKSKHKTCNFDSISNFSSPALKSKKKSKTKRKKERQGDTEDIVIESQNKKKVDWDVDLNPEISVKVIWKSVGIKKFKIRKFQKMSKIYKDLSKEENIPENQIHLTFKSIKVNYDDTPSLLNLQIYDFLEGGVLSEAADLGSGKVTSEIQVNNVDIIMLKFQDCNKKSIKIHINKTDKMKVGMIKYSEQTEIPLENIKFLFDGELLDPCETPQTLSLDGDEIIDVKIMR